MAIAQHGRFLPLQDFLFGWFKRSLGTRSLQLESMQKFQQMGRFTSSLVLRLEFSNLLLLEHLVFSESLNERVCSFGLAFDGTPNLILHFAFCFGSFSASDACDGFPLQNSSHGEASSIAACLICAITRSSSCPGVLVSLSTDPEQKPSIVSHCWPITKSNFEAKAMPLQTAQDKCGSSE
jgi:hypothetical protein